MNTIRYLVLWSIILLVGGCSTPVQRPPGSEPGSHPDGTGGRVRNESNVYEPRGLVRSQPEYSTPVIALMDVAARQEKQNDLAAAVSSVERALRIEPRNAFLWSRLADLRLKQKQFPLAIQLASKSNSLAAGDASLVSKNWALTAKAQRGAGNTSAAEAAERKARNYR
ncbi:MAG: hypothetical protein GY703_07220 [Gammaproteobacteria bacterium]|nr:hypothetical protein [Gammaproteobacteria bacterium]